MVDLPWRRECYFDLEITAHVWQSKNFFFVITGLWHFKLLFPFPPLILVCLAFEEYHAQYNPLCQWVSTEGSRNILGWRAGTAYRLDKTANHNPISQYINISLIKPSPNAHSHLIPHRLYGTEWNFGWKRDSGLNHLWLKYPSCANIIMPHHMNITAKLHSSPGLEADAHWLPGKLASGSSYFNNFRNPHPHSPGLLPSTSFVFLPISICS